MAEQVAKQPLTGAERMRRSRERAKLEAEGVELVDGVAIPRDVLEALVAARFLQESREHRAADVATILKLLTQPRVMDAVVLAFRDIAVREFGLSCDDVTPECEDRGGGSKT